MEFTKKIKDAAEKGAEKAADLGKEAAEKGKDAAREGYQETKEAAREAKDRAESWSSCSCVQLHASLAVAGIVFPSRSEKFVECLFFEWVI